jgi:hypothetical protein
MSFHHNNISRNQLLRNFCMFFVTLISHKGQDYTMEDQ